MNEFSLVKIPSPVESFNVAKLAYRQQIVNLINKATAHAETSVYIGQLLTPKLYLSIFLADVLQELKDAGYEITERESSVVISFEHVKSEA
jgi:hypothetical protein